MTADAPASTAIPQAPPTGRAPLGMILLLSALTVIAPLSIDMYLPALPTIAKDFGVGAGEAQMTLSAYFLGFAVGQAFYGPVVDRFGRKPPLYVGMFICVIASVVCALAPSIATLTGFRLLQALGACAGGVVSRAMVRDLFTPAQASKVYSSLMLVTGLAPMLAPLLGGYLLIWFGWRAIFLFLAAIMSACLLVVHFRLEETHRPVGSVESRAQSFAIGRILSGYFHLMSERRYLGYALCSGFAISGMFIYVAGSPFIFINIYGISAEHFGWIFGANAVAMVTGGQVNGRLVGRLTPAELLRRAVLVQTVAGLLILANAITGFGGLYGFLAPLMLFSACTPFIMSNATVLAMVPHGRVAGMASALLGTFQFGIGSLAATIIGLVQNGTALPLGIGMAVCGAAGLVVNRTLVGREEPSAST